MKFEILKDILSGVINTEENRFMDNGYKNRMFVCKCFGGTKNIF